MQYFPFNVGDGDFTLSTDYIGNNSQRDIFFLSGNVESGASTLINGVESGSPRTVTSVDGYVTVVIRKQNDDDLNPANYHIMLNSGSAPLPYEPYTGGAPSPSPDYPQEIVSAGKYDEGTGKYQYTIKISDSEESPTKSQTVILTSDRQLTKWDKLEKRNGQWGWVYKSTTLKMDENVNVADANGEVGETAPYRLYGAIGVHKSEGKIACISNILRGISNSNWNSNSAIGTYLMNDGNVNFRLKSEWVSDANAAKQFLIEHDAYFMYETEEETFVPLSESEQEAMNELYTFRPTTVLSNDCDCNMSLTYKTKKSLEVTT